MIETDLFTYLSNHASIVALVGDRIYPNLAPKDTPLPYLVYFKVSAARNYTHNGFANLQRVRMQVSCFSDRYLTEGANVGAKSLAQTLISVIEAWTGASGIQSSLVEDEKDLIDPDTKYYHVAVDFFVTYGS